jgi:hypothetical protein
MEAGHESKIWGDVVAIIERQVNAGQKLNGLLLSQSLFPK